MAVKDKITEAATELFLLNDYDTVSVREVALLAGVSNTYIHKLFGKKEQLFTALLEESDNELCAYLEEVPKESLVLELLNNRNHKLFRLLMTGCISKKSYEFVIKWLAVSETFKMISEGIELGEPCRDVFYYVLVQELIFGGLIRTSGVLDALGWKNDEIQGVENCWHTFILGYTSGRSSQRKKETEA